MIVYVDAVPTQPFKVGVTVTVEVTAVAAVLVAEKAGGFPEPLAPKPTAVLLLLQVKVVPANGPDSVVIGAVTPSQ